MRGRGRGIINPKNLGYGVPLAIIGGKFKVSSTMLADLNDDCTLALLKRFSSAQLFAFVSSPEFSNRRLRDCAMVALKDVYAPFSLKSSINAEGTYAVYVADAKNDKMAVLKHPDLFHRSPLSDFLDKADTHLTCDFGSANLSVWLDAAQAISVSQLQLSFSCVSWDTPSRGSSVRQLMQAFSSVRSLCISADSLYTCRRRGVVDFALFKREAADMLEAIGISLLQKPLRVLVVVFQSAECGALALSVYFKLHLLLTHYLPRSAALESIDLGGFFVKPTRTFPVPYPGEDPCACERLLCDMLANLKANRALKCIKLRCHIQCICVLQEKLPEDCKIVELNGEPVLNEEILKRMHCSPDKVLIVQEKQGMDEEGQAEKLYLHIDCLPPTTTFALKADF